MSERRGQRLLGATLALAVGLVTVVGLSAPAYAATPPTTPTWTATVPLPGGGTFTVNAVCNAYLPYGVTFVSAGTGTANTWNGVPTVTFPSGYAPQFRFSCLSGYGMGLAGGDNDNAKMSTVRIQSGHILNATQPLIGDNEAIASDAAEGWYSGYITMNGHTTNHHYAQDPAQWNDSNDEVLSYFNLSHLGGGGGNVKINWLAAAEDIGAMPPMPDRPAEAVTAGVDPYVGPSYCDITAVTGDVSETVPKDPAQTYRYEISFAGRNGMTPAPDQIGFSAAWQENVASSRVPYANITTKSPDAIQQPGEAWAGIAQWPTPPLVSPLVIEVVFPERKPYALRIGCLSDDGKISYWVAGDLEPDPNSDEIWKDLRDQHLQECVPDGWGILNPIAFVRGLGCTLDYLFHPDLEEAFEPVTDAKDSSLVGQAVLVGGTLKNGVDSLNASVGSGATCEGPTYTFPNSISVKPFEACTGYPHTIALFVRGIAMLGLIIAVALKFLRMLGYAVDARDPVEG